MAIKTASIDFKKEKYTSITGGTSYRWNKPIDENLKLQFDVNDSTLGNGHISVSSEGLNLLNTNTNNSLFGQGLRCINIELEPYKIISKVKLSTSKKIVFDKPITIYAGFSQSSDKNNNVLSWKPIVDLDTDSLDITNNSLTIDINSAKVLNIYNSFDTNYLKTASSTICIYPYLNEDITIYSVEVFYDNDRNVDIIDPVTGKPNKPSTITKNIIDFHLEPKKYLYLDRLNELENNVFNINYDKVSNDLDINRTNNKDYIVIHGDWNAKEGDEGFIKNKPENLAYIMDLPWEHGRAGDGSVQLRRSTSYAEGDFSTAEGYGSFAIGIGSHVEGLHNTAIGKTAHAEGSLSYAIEDFSHAEGNNTYALGESAHSEGASTKAQGFCSHVEGFKSESNGMASHAEGRSEANGDYSHSEGHSTNSIGDNSHSEGFFSKAYGNASHSEGNSTISYGDYSHSGGINSYTKGIASFTHGTNTQSYNNNEVSFGKWNKSYLETDKLRYDDKEISAGGSIFTIGDGNNETSRHNILSIYENGDMLKDTGSSYFNNEVYAPVSYSYVESLGKTAYLTTILSALLDSPKYTKPTVSGTPTPSGYIQYGNTVDHSITFTASYVAPNYNDIDPIYGKELGNRLGYSTGITSINYTYCNYDGNEIKYYNGTYSNPRTGNTLSAINNQGETVNATIDGFTFEGNLTKQNGLFNGSLAKVSTKVTINNAFKPKREGKYVMSYMTAYSYTGATQMYFQQLAEKSTYVPNDGVPPTDKFSSGNGTVSSNKSYIYVTHNIYYGTLAGNDITTLEIYKTGKPTGTVVRLECIDYSGLGYGENGCENHGEVSKISSVTTTSISGSPSIFWIAVPSDYVFNGNPIEESTKHMNTEIVTDDSSIRTLANGVYPCCVRLEKYDSNLSNYLIINTTSGDQPVDTDLNGAAMTLYKIQSKNSDGLKYDIYYVKGTGSIPNGPIRFKVKRVW